jgi:hypothetical protein
LSSYSEPGCESSSSFGFSCFPFFMCRDSSQLTPYKWGQKFYPILLIKKRKFPFNLRKTRRTVTTNHKRITTKACNLSTNKNQRLKEHKVGRNTHREDMTT